MYITIGHFLESYVVVLKNNEPVGRLVAIDTDLLIAQRMVGFNQVTGEPITDLIKIDEVRFDLEKMPEHLKDLLPSNFQSL